MDVVKYAVQNSACNGCISDEIRPAGQVRRLSTATHTDLTTYGIKKLFRFILSHPDMDHMDGLAALHEKIGFTNFWHTGHRRPKPSFDGGWYNEEDWDLYESLVNGKLKEVTVLKKLAGDRFPFANKNDDDGKTPDALYILAPNKELLKDDIGDDVNESSYVIQYQCAAGPMIFPGDAHDVSWELVMKDANLKDNCSFLLAPHHGRDSDRSYDFLDHLQPKLTVFGCAPSEHLAYKQWSDRKLLTITSNQAGNIVLEIETGHYDVYVENKKFAEDRGGNVNVTNDQGYFFWHRITQ